MLGVFFTKIYIIKVAALTCEIRKKNENKKYVLMESVGLGFYI